MRNLEVKAKINSISDAAQKCEQFGAELNWRREQTDLYFSPPNDCRLKIRIEEDCEPYLVLYSRPNETGARHCSYGLYNFTSQSEMHIRNIFSPHGSAHRNTMFVLPCSTYCKSCCSQISLNRLELKLDRETPSDSPIYGIINIGMKMKVTVRKTRTLYMWENVRIHLDEVDGLGTFLEFEHPMSQHTEDEVRKRLEFLSNKLGIRPEDTLEGSYSNLLLSLGQK